MKQLILALLVTSIPVVAAAQPADPVTPREGTVIPAAAESMAVQSSAATPGVRRRPSMVGYIENATIQSRIRVRFDAGHGLQSPDRAEFFYAKCGCYRFLPATHPGYDPDAAGPGPGVLTDANYTQFNVYAEYALASGFSLVGDLPIRSLKPQAFVPGTGSFGDSSGISDVRAGVKVSLAGGSSGDLTFQGMVTAPTGDSMKGLGTDHWSIEPAILYAGELADGVGLEAQFGTIFPTDGSKGVPISSPDRFSGRVIYYGIGPSVDIYRSGTTRLAPVVELVGWHVVDGYSTADGGPANGTNIVNLKIGARAAFGAGSLYVGWGKGLTDAVWYDDIVRVEFRYGF